MYEKKTASPSHSNQDRTTVKADSEKKIDLFTNIPMNNMTELNNLICAGAKQVC